MGQGAFSATQVEEKGGGLYNVSNIVMIMGGHWEKRVTIKKGIRKTGLYLTFPRSGPRSPMNISQ